MVAAAEGRPTGAQRMTAAQAAAAGAMEHAPLHVSKELYEEPNVPRKM